MIERATSNFLKTMKGESFQASGTTGFQRNGCRMQNSSRRISWLMRCFFIHVVLTSSPHSLPIKSPLLCDVLKDLRSDFLLKNKPSLSVSCVAWLASPAADNKDFFTKLRLSTFFLSTFFHRVRVETLANVKDNSIDFSRRCTEQRYLFFQGEQFKSPDILHSVRKTLCNVHLQKADSAVTCFLLQVLFHVLQQQTQSSVRQTQLSWTPCTSPSQFTCLHGEMFCIRNIWQL